MGKKEELRMDDNSMNVLSSEELEDVVGGRITGGGYVLLYAAVKQFQALGKDKAYAIKAITEGWNKGCKFKAYTTDGTDEDLQSAIAFINSVW